MWRVGIDVGGTFTDLFAWDDESRQQVSSKVLTTKHDRAVGVVNAIKAAKIPFARISYLMHGTTTATNALIVRDYPDAAMVTTEGFRDTIEIARQHREQLYDPYQTKPKPIIKRRFRYTVGERIDVRGEVVRPLLREQALEVAHKIKQHNVRSVAVAFINSYKNGAHEQAMRDIIKEVNPDTYVVLSSETRPVFREHGRFTTTAIRAATIPVMEVYFERLENALRAEGFAGRLLILKSSGGICGVDYAKQHPEELIESGPAGGVAYAGYLSKLLPEFPNIIHTDVGGTSFDVSIVENGHGLITRDHEIEWEIPCIVPMLDIHSVGAGGGSVGWVDEGGSLRVGPRSAGSSPGPVCYGLGGTEPTITDANLLLGRIEPTLGGKMTLDKAGAEATMERLAAEVGLSGIETADGMIRIGCENMAQAVKKVLVSRGRDPRDFVLASFGGAGAMHACFVAESMNIPKVVMPIHAGVASAFGATAMDLRHDLETFYFSPVADAKLDDLNALYSKLEADVMERLEAEGVSRENIDTTRTAQMRYVGQTYEVETPVPDGKLTAASVAGIIETFHEVHKREYGVSSSDFAPAFVSLGVTGIGRTESPPAVEVGGSGGAAVKGERQIYFNRAWHASKVYDGHALKPNASLDGPCIVEYEHACAVLPPNAVGTVDRFGNLIIDISRNLVSNV
ncbi:MAG TPA: hydantoinase/oxoprolinase family protein [Gammaproteobacteria bacterium]|nr:hydantoinase/oxoprolinase family protein [Gammaproteobacteria bacterium]